MLSASAEGQDLYISSDHTNAVHLSVDILYYPCHFTVYRKRFPNLVNASWLWRISRGNWAAKRNGEMIWLNNNITKLNTTY